MLLKILCELFYSTIVNTREKLILTMLEEIRVYLMKKIVARGELLDRLTIAIDTRIQKILDKNSKLARFEGGEHIEMRSSKFSTMQSLYYML